MAEPIDLTKRRIDAALESQNNKNWTPKDMLTHLLMQIEKGGIPNDKMMVIIPYPDEDDPYFVLWEAFRANMPGGMVRMIAQDMIEDF